VQTTDADGVELQPVAQPQHSELSNINPLHREGLSPVEAEEQDGAGAGAGAGAASAARLRLEKMGAMEDQTCEFRSLPTQTVCQLRVLC
jgi:hypothetical protein